MPNLCTPRLRRQPSSCCVRGARTCLLQPALPSLKYSAKQPGFRVLEDRYGANLLAVAVPKGHARRLAYVSEFIEEAKASGLAQRAIDRAGPHEIAVATTEDVH